MRYRAPCDIANNDSCAARFDRRPRRQRHRTSSFPWSSRIPPGSGFAADDDADFAGLMDRYSEALAAELGAAAVFQLHYPCFKNYFDLASAWILKVWNEDLGRVGRSWIDVESIVEQSRDTIEFHLARSSLGRHRIRPDESCESTAAA